MDTQGCRLASVLVPVLSSCILLMLSCSVDAAFRFTQKPPNVLYVVKGRTARLVWDYQLDGSTNLDSLSPGWYFFDPHAKRIGYEDAYDGWLFATSTCPSRLLKPTVRVKKESTATFIITNVTTADNGIYGCIIGFKSGGPSVISKVKLVVTDAAFRFTRKPPNVLYVVKGRTARFVWDYQLDGGSRLRSSSPGWYFFDPHAKQIGYEDAYDGWLFTTSTCPSRLLKPTVRVKKQSKATFIITNVTTADNGIYGCIIGFNSGGPLVISKVKLIVTDMMLDFIKVPPSTMYVQSGQAAMFVWDYVVGNKTTTFDLHSPRWQVYNSNSGWTIIGVDDGILGWKWQLSSSCPARLQNPTRVSKASTASLVIYNVTTEDSGIYRCNLTLRHRPPITSTSRLIVTVAPHYTTQPRSTKNIKEGQDLSILCTAVGTPTPNVTWVQVQGVTMVTKTQGVGSATLSIPNIRRHQTGTYECQAVNNPNLPAVTTQTRINVMYKPSIDDSKSDVAAIVIPGGVSRLRCVVSGFPNPRVMWYKPNGQPITQNITSWFGVSEVSVNIKDTEDYGLYKCGVDNTLGYAEHNITVVPFVVSSNSLQRDRKGSIEYGKDLVVIVCIVIIVVLIVVIVTGIYFLIKLTRYSKGKDDKKSSRRGPRHRGQDFVNMSEIPPSPPTPPSLHVSKMPEQGTGLHNSVYEQPVDEPRVLIPGPTATSYPYEIPELTIVPDNNASGDSVSSSRYGQYQELNQLNVSTHDYQSLDIQSAAAKPFCLQSEISNAYEPLKSNNESQYEKIDRH